MLTPPRAPRPQYSPFGRVAFLPLQRYRQLLPQSTGAAAFWNSEASYKNDQALIPQHPATPCDPTRQIFPHIFPGRR